ncbi:DUF418 domain-containing protein [Paludibacter sp. 221]|uniref:DUF418 domain-containing protein n=1 Tax=Paludibacter sp. 221 TaxID=2302939 RepID=UPI0013D28DA0|nr:DUF418 domain-containing protein [Paludibacter sp. 221]NDV45623.1 DUF418 domain-containing protein [Paludibacter sp. 221]
MEKKSRIDVADVLRGIAVLGIVLLHSVEHFNFYSYPDTSTQSQFLNFTDKIIWDGLFFTFGGKAYAIFALLFGFSFFIQDDNRYKKGEDFRPRFMWRMVLLFLIGNINAMFFTGEVLVMYSLVGFVLVLVCRLPSRVILVIATVFMLQPVEWAKLITVLFNPDYVPQDSLSSHFFEKAYEVQANGTFWETLKMNLWDGQLASLTWAWEHGRIFQTAALFMYGLLAGRKRLFLYSENNMKKWLGTLGVALIAYFPLAGLKNMFPDFISDKSILASLNLIFSSYANFAFMSILVSGIVLAFYTSRFYGILMKIAPYGRMSLTNYITQSIVGSMLFYNWGFGLHQYLGITYSFLVGIGLFILQFVFCRWWLKRFTHGPLEYVWKKATWIGKA